MIDNIMKFITKATELGIPLKVGQAVKKNIFRKHSTQIVNPTVYIEKQALFMNSLKIKIHEIIPVFIYILEI